MTKIGLFATVALATALPISAQAQNVLDRTDPTQGERKEIERTDPAEKTIIPPVIIDNSSQQLVSDRTYAVGAIIVTGSRIIEPAAFVGIIQRYSARDVRSAELNKLTEEVAAVARARGYIFATAAIKPQNLGAGVLRVELDEGTIDEIRLVGENDPAIRAQLEPLRTEGPVTLANLERRILLADDISGVYIRNTRFEREGETGVLIVKTGRSKFSGAVELENDGSQPVGPEQLTIDFDANGLISPFDEFDVTVSTTPFQPEELQYGRVRYGAVVDSSGTEISAVGSYSMTEPGAYLSDRGVLGRSWRVGAEISRPILRSRDLSVWVEGELELRDLRQERDGELARQDRIPVTRASLYSIAEIAGGRMRSKLTLSRGLDILGATQDGDKLASRSDASADFTSLSGWFEWERDLIDRVSVEVAGRGQLSADPLLITEDIGLGGTQFLRGYNFSERTGDEGIMGYGELRYEWDKPFGLVRKMELYAYADGGVVGNLNDGRGGGSLASGGGGIRTDITRDLDFNLEIAVPLTGPRFDTDDLSPRFNFRIRQAL